MPGNPLSMHRLPEWCAAAARGHALGNHTLFHPCARNAPGRAWVRPEDDLDTTSAERLAAQVHLGNTMLQAIDGQTRRTFTAPCGDLLAAGQPYLPLVAGSFVAMKVGWGGVVEDLRTLDPQAVPVATPDGWTGEQLIALAAHPDRFWVDSFVHIMDHPAAHPPR